MADNINLQSDSVDQAHPTEPICVQPQTSLREVLLSMKASNRGAVLVCDDGRVVGLFTERDAVRRMAQGEPLDIPIASVMRPSPLTLHRGATVADAIRKMLDGGYRRLPIVDPDGRPTGIVNVRGILHYLVDHFPKLVYTLPPTPHQSPQDREGA